MQSALVGNFREAALILRLFVFKQLCRLLQLMLSWQIHLYSLIPRLANGVNVGAGIVDIRFAKLTMPMESKCTCKSSDRIGGTWEEMRSQLLDGWTMEEGQKREACSISREYEHFSGKYLVGLPNPAILRKS